MNKVVYKTQSRELYELLI